MSLPPILFLSRFALHAAELRPPRRTKQYLFSFTRAAHENPMEINQPEKKNALQKSESHSTVRYRKFLFLETHLSFRSSQQRPYNCKLPKVALPGRDPASLFRCVERANQTKSPMACERKTIKHNTSSLMHRSSSEWSRSIHAFRQTRCRPW